MVCFRYALPVLSLLLPLCLARKAIIQVSYESSKERAELAACDYGPILNRKAIQLVKADVEVVALVDDTIANRCGKLYTVNNVSVLRLHRPPPEIAALLGNRPENSGKLGMFNLGNTFQHGDKLLFMDTDAYLTGIDVEEMFDLVNDQDGHRLLMAADPDPIFEGNSGAMLLSYRLSDHETLMETCRILVAKGVRVNGDQEVFNYHAYAYLKSMFFLPGTMNLFPMRALKNAEGLERLLSSPLEGGKPAVQIIHLTHSGGRLAFFCKDPTARYGTASEFGGPLLNTLAWVCCQMQAAVDDNHRFALVSSTSLSLISLHIGVCFVPLLDVQDTISLCLPVAQRTRRSAL
jgi:hypothetical protein